MALTVGELNARLSVDNDAFRRGLNEARTDLNSLARDAERQSTSVETRTDRLVSHVGKAMRDTGKVADREGRESGSKLARGIEQGVVRNSPLIVAAIGGALAAGAPLALTGATALFGSIGIAAQAQSLAVRNAWSGTWDDIKSEAFEQSRALEPVLVGLADEVGEAFRRMGPSLTDAFDSAAPQLQVFARGLLGLTENALPGLVRAVESGMPVTRGLASLLEQVGTGLTEFLDGMSAHAPAAGQAFEALGGVIANMLPTLGEVLGQGAELAAGVLPPLADALGVVADVSGALGPILPTVAAGFIALKAAQAAAGWVGGLGDKMKDLPGRMAGVNAGTAALGITLGLAASGYQRATDQGQRWAEMLREGGAAAEQAQRQMSSFGNAFEEVNSGWDGFANALLGTSGQISATAIAMGEAEDATRDLWQSMSPLEQAEAKVAEWTETLSYRMSKYGQDSELTEAAQRRLARWTGELAGEQGDLEMALDGVTTAMIEQAQQALAASDAEYRYRGAVEDVDDQLRAVAEAQRDYGAASEEANDALYRLEGTLRSAAQAAGQMAADALPASATELQRNEASAAAYLAELLRLRDMMGSSFPAALNEMIGDLQQTGVQLDTVSGQAANATGQLQTLGAQRPNPVAYLNAVPFFGEASAVASRVNALDVLRASPIATLIPDVFNAEWWLNHTARNRTSTVTQYVQQVLSGVPLFNGPRADGGAIGRAGGGSVTGPGGPRDDRIPALGPGGQQYRLSDGEHILDAVDVALLGGQAGVYAFRAALNEGRAQVVKPVGRADGGPIGGGAAPAVSPAQAPGVTVERLDLNVNVDGTFDLRDRYSMRVLARALGADIEDELNLRLRASR